MSPARSPGRVEDELAERAAVEQRPVRVRRFGQRVLAPITARSDPSASRPSRSVDRLGEHAGTLQHVHQPEADHRLAARHQHAGVDRATAGCGRPCRTPRAGRAAPARRGSRRRRGRRSSRARCRRCLPPLASRSAAADRRRASRWRRRRRGRGTSCRFSSRRGGRDHPSGAPPLGELDRDSADAAGAGVDDDGLARLQVRGGAQQVPGGRTLHERGQRGAVATPRPGSGTAGAGRARSARRSRRCRPARAAAARRASRTTTSPPGISGRLCLAR